ncbi:MAG: ATP-binding protein [Cytophagaceae bacterium]|nr:ATP-binding protein [Cytophagaceae bacterium]MDW8457248.1 ATP-binding protein [Cytophagaceae bacterium]
MYFRIMLFLSIVFNAANMGATDFDIKYAHVNGCVFSLGQQIHFPDSVVWYDLNNRKLNLGFSTDTVWLKIKFDTPVINQVVQLQNSHLDFVQACYVYKNELYKQITTGDFADYSSRDLPDNYFSFLLSDSTEFLYIKLNTQGLLSAPVAINDYRTYLSEHNKQTNFIFFIFGVSFIVVMSSLLFGFFLKNKTYLLYSLYALSTAFIIQIDFGYLYEWAWPHYPKANQYNMALYASAAIPVLLFVGHVLQIYTANLFQKWCYFSLLAFNFLVISINLAGNYSLATKINSYLTLICLLWMYISVFIVTIKKQKIHLVIFTCGFTLNSIGILLYLLAIQGVLPYSRFWANVYAGGSFAQMLFFFVGVVYNVNEVRIEWLRHKEKLFTLLEENEKILRSQNQLLEEKINERTKELQEMNEEMTQQNEELQIQRTELELINEELNQKNNTIQELNQKLRDQNLNLENLIQKRTKEILDAYAELKDKNSRLEQFAYVTSHNLRGPIATLLGLVQLIPQSRGDELEFLLDKIHLTTKKLDMVIKGLSSVLDIQKNYSTMKEPVRFADVLDDVKIMLQREIKESQAQLIINTHDNVSIYAIPIYLNNILYNLISNAIKYAKPRITPVITISITELDTHTKLSVSDNGIGIDIDKHKDKLFFPFKRFHDNVEGTGLGLFIIKTQMEIMNGSVDIQSKVGEGTTFTLTFPNNRIYESMST